MPKNNTRTKTQGTQNTKTATTGRQGRSVQRSNRSGKRTQKAPAQDKLETLAKKLKFRKNSKVAELLTQLETLWKSHVPREPDTGARQGKPGVYYDIPFAEYCDIAAVNFSSLKNLNYSPYHYRYSASKAEETSAMRLGNLHHTAILEPESLLSRYVIMPDFTRNVGNDPKTGKPYLSPKSTKIYKELVAAFVQKHHPKIVIDRDDFEQLVAINRAVYSHEGATAILSEAKREVTLIWHDPVTNILCKARLDALSDEYEIIFDLKTTAKFVTEFGLDDFCYHQQAAHYQNGLRVLTGKTYTPYIGAVEKTDPYAYSQAPIHPEALALGSQEIQAKLIQLAHCRKTKTWPLPDDPDHWNLKPYYKPFRSLHLTN